MRTLTVVCPVRDEEAVILAFHEELSRVLAGLDGWSTSALYVVDGGTDRTRELLRGLAAADRSVRVLALSSHFGQQAALLAGLDHCDADAVVMMDGDLQHPPALIPTLLAAHERGTTSSTPSGRTRRRSRSGSASPRASSTASPAPSPTRRSTRGRPTSAWCRGAWWRSSSAASASAACS